MEDSMTAVRRKILDQRGKLFNHLVTQFKGTKPFPQESFTPAQKIWASENLGYEDMGALRQEFGDEAVNYTLKKINDLRGKGWRTGQI